MLKFYVQSQAPNVTQTSLYIGHLGLGLIRVVLRILYSIWVNLLHIF